MAQMRQRSRTRHTTRIGSNHTPSGTPGSAILPVLSQFFAQFLAGRGPVVADAVAEFGDVAFEVEFVLFEPGDVEFLSGGAAFELAGDVFFVVADDSRVDQ